MLEEITLKEANLKFMEQRNRIMKEIISEKKLQLQKERDVLVLTVYFEFSGLIALSQRLDNADV